MAVVVGLAAATAETSGASMIYNIAGGPNVSIVCTVVIENRTGHPLLYPKSYNNAGEMQSPPVAIRPGNKESFVSCTDHAKHQY